MINRPPGDDADLIIETRWPTAYDEDKLKSTAAHHRAQQAIATHDVAPHLDAAHTETVQNMAGRLATKARNTMAKHVKANADNVDRHDVCATEIEALADAVRTAKTRIIGAVDTFTAMWADAPEVARRNNWHQLQYNDYRTRLINDGRDTVTHALSELAATHQSSRKTIHTALHNTGPGHRS